MTPSQNSQSSQEYKQGVALTARNTTGPPAVIRLEAAWRHCLAWAGEAAPSLIIAHCGVLQTTTTDAREQNNTGPPYTHYV